MPLYLHDRNRHDTMEKKKKKQQEGKTVIVKEHTLGYT